MKSRLLRYFAILLLFFTICLAIARNFREQNTSFKEGFIIAASVLGGLLLLMFIRGALVKLSVIGSGLLWRSFRDGPLWRRQVMIYGFVVLFAGAWLFGTDLIGWCLRFPK
jgi:hypothetical protein